MSKDKKLNEQPEQTDEQVAQESGKVSELEAALQEKDTYLQMAQRVQADFDNYRKRNATLRTDAYNEGVCEAVDKLLPILDNMERALLSETQKDSKLYEGLTLICKQFSDQLTGLGIEEIPTDCSFDPQLHEAIATVETEKEEEPGTVADVLRKGYTMKGKVIRHSMVRVFR